MKAWSAVLLLLVIGGFLLYGGSDDPDFSSCLSTQDPGAVMVNGCIVLPALKEEVVSLGNPLGYLNLGRAQHVRGNLAEARKNYETAMFLASTRDDFRSLEILTTSQANLAVLMIQAGDFENAEITLMACLSLKPNYGPAVLYLSALLNGQRRYTETISLIDAAFAQGFGPGFSSLSGPLYMAKGTALCSQGFAEQANSNFQYAAAHYADIPSVQCSQEEGF